MIIFKSKEFIDKLRHIASLPTTYYSGGNQWSTWNGRSWNFDCVVSVKSVLWGWNENKKVMHGGARLGANGVKDFTCNEGLDYCTEVSTNFRNIVPGEYLCMKGTKFDHVGVYLGNGKVFEVTTAWGVNGATISDIDNNGNRYKNGSQSLRWTYHGKLKWIDYNDNPQTVPTDKKVNVYYKVRTKRHGWLPEVKNLDDYAGWEDSPITGVAIKVDRGSIWYQAHIKGGDWLGRVTGCDINDYYNGYAGNGKEIDCIRIYYNTPNDIRPFKRAKYRVNNLPWQYDDEYDKNNENFAGEYGKSAVKLEIIIE